MITSLFNGLYYLNIFRIFFIRLAWMQCQTNFMTTTVGRSELVGRRYRLPP
jgi:hypothetical protein